MTYALVIVTCAGESWLAGPRTSYVQAKDRGACMVYAHPSEVRRAWASFQSRFRYYGTLRPATGYMVKFRDLPGVLSNRLPLPTALP